MKNSTINKKEIDKFSRMAEEWWNPNGKFKPLHKFNPIRISYIKDNIIKTLKTGKMAPKNPWKANSLEWHTSTVPPEHGNFGEKLPVVHRWPYDFSVPGAKDDFIPQTTPPSEVAHTKVEKT